MNPCASPYSPPALVRRKRKRSCASSGRRLTMGEEVHRLEEELAALSQAKFALAVSNCTAALHLACAALNVGPSDEVLCPTLTFVASANARGAGAPSDFANRSARTICVSTPPPLRRNSALGREPSSPSIMPASPAVWTNYRPWRTRGIPLIEDCAPCAFHNLPWQSAWASRPGRLLQLFFQ